MPRLRAVQDGDVGVDASARSRGRHWGVSTNLNRPPAAGAAGSRRGELHPAGCPRRVHQHLRGRGFRRGTATRPRSSAGRFVLLDEGATVLMMFGSTSWSKGEQRGLLVPPRQRGCVPAECPLGGSTRSARRRESRPASRPSGARRLRRLDPGGMNALAPELFDNLLAEATQVHAVTGQLRVLSQHAEQMPGGRLSVKAEQQVRRGQVEEAERVEFLLWQRRA
jgi:hypothetical protein